MYLIIPLLLHALRLHVYRLLTVRLFRLLTFLFYDFIRLRQAWNKNIIEAFVSIARMVFLDSHDRICRCGEKQFRE